MERVGWKLRRTLHPFRLHWTICSDAGQLDGNGAGAGAMPDSGLGVIIASGGLTAGTGAGAVA